MMKHVIRGFVRSTMTRNAKMQSCFDLGFKFKSMISPTKFQTISSSIRTPSSGIPSSYFLLRVLRQHLNLMKNPLQKSRISTLRNQLVKEKNYKNKHCYHSNYLTSQKLASLHTTCLPSRMKHRSSSDRAVQQTITGICEVTRDHMTPEIALHLITPACRLWSEDHHTVLKESGISDPFWAFFWPGGQVLTRYILDHPSVVLGKRILDVGSGCGASAIAAALCGAKSVLASDIDKVAIQAIKLNAALNNVTVETTVRNLIGCLEDQWDVVFLGDMFYDVEFADIVADWLTDVARRDTGIFIGDPGRIYLQDHPIRQQLTNVFEMDLSERCRLENSGMTRGFVWKFQWADRRL